MVDFEIQSAFLQQNILNDSFFHTEQHVMDPNMQEALSIKMYPVLKILAGPWRLSASADGSCPVTEVSFSACLFQ